MTQVFLFIELTLTVAVVTKIAANIGLHVNRENVILDHNLKVLQTKAFFYLLIQTVFLKIRYQHR